MSSVTEIHVYPVKSCCEWTLKEANIVSTGFKHDREWMVVEEDGYFISQRQFPKMATIRPSLSDGKLILTAPGVARVVAPIISGPTKKAVIWENQCDVSDQGDEIAKWLSAFLGKSVRLVRMADGFERKLKEKYQKRGSEVVGFADSMPFLLTSEVSLADLNEKLQTPLPMDRFRPNIVISGDMPFEEDTWKKIRIGRVVFSVSKGCARCEITTINQQTGEKGSEPLETLGRYRTGPKGIMFGQHLIQEADGVIKVGDDVEVLE